MTVTGNKRFLLLGQPSHRMELPPHRPPPQLEGVGEGWRRYVDRLLKTNHMIPPMKCDLPF